MEEIEILNPADLIPLEVAPLEPRIVAQTGEPRRVNNLSLIDGKTFLATTISGDITPPSAPDVGLFYRDTRFLSHLEIKVNGHRTVVLSASTQQNLFSQIDMTTTNIVVRDSLDLPENTIHIRREQLLAGRFFDRLLLQNHNQQAVDLLLELCFDADFADVFQVRGMLRHHTGTYFEPVIRTHTLSFGYLGRDSTFRQTLLDFDPAPDELEAHSARFHLMLLPGEKRQIDMTVHTLVDGADTHIVAPTFAQCLQARRHNYIDWERESTAFESSNEVFNTCLQTAMADFFALRVPFAPHGEIIAAGIPWFATIFGRDSLVAAYQSLMLHPNLARQTLRYLAERQGAVRDDWRDEEPGKILHEVREGEMTRAGEMPHSPYFGSVDSTPLFLIVLSETWNWTGDRQLLDDLLPAAYRAITWIEKEGDLDGDGFIEYLRRSPQGLVNQGWKDSWDANMHCDGRMVEPPTALCEVQGYCYDARYRFARLLHGLGDTATAERLRQQAADLAHHFEQAFWMPGQEYFAMSLDRTKNQQAVVSSNAGQLLWSRIISRERADKVVNRLMREDMFSGWGIRTISAADPMFNPLSYHRGSVWPHDNSLIAEGFAFYNYKEQLLRIFTGLFQAATYFRNLRLPELFVGVERRDFEEPVHYPVSCSPQAWASGAFFLLLTSSLGLRPNASRRELRVVNPMLPEWLTWLRIHHLRVGRSRVSLEFSRRGHRTFCNVLDVEGDPLSVSVDFTQPGVQRHL